MLDKIMIRQLQKSDNFIELVKLSRDFFQEYESNHEYFFKIDSLDDKGITEYFSRFVDSEQRQAFIAILEGCIVGYITIYIEEQPLYWKIKKVGHISGLMVKKEYRRRGIAKQLLLQSKAFFKEKGVKYYTLYTSVNNLDAIKFYEDNEMTPLYIHLIGEVDG